MKLQRTTLILIFLALGLTVFVYCFEIQGKPQREAIAAKEQQLFGFKSEQVQSFTLKTQQNTLTFERVSGKKSGDSNWQLKTPIQGEANEASVVFLLDKLTTGKSDRTLRAATSQRSEYGLDQPQATVEVKLNNQQTHKFILGKPDFSGNFLYAQIDPSLQKAQNLSVVLVPIEFKNAVDRPLSEWQEKPSEVLDPRDR